MPPQDIITRDNVTLKVNAVITLKVIDPSRAVIEVMNFVYQTSQFAQTTLRSVLGEVELDELLSHREALNQRIQSIIDQHTAPWGVKVVSVEGEARWICPNRCCGPWRSRRKRNARSAPK